MANIEIENEPKRIRFWRGAKVQWESSSHNKTNLKRGSVVEVVKKGKRPTVKITSGPNVGAARDHRSYVVKAEGRTYWPNAAALLHDEADADKGAA